MKKKVEWILKESLLMVLVFVVSLSLIFLLFNDGIARRCVHIPSPQSVIQQGDAVTYYYNVGKGKIIESSFELESNSLYCYPIEINKIK